MLLTSKQSLEPGSKVPQTFGRAGSACIVQPPFCVDVSKNGQSSIKAYSGLSGASANITCGESTISPSRGLSSSLTSDFVGLFILIRFAPADYISSCSSTLSSMTMPLLQHAPLQLPPPQKPSILDDVTGIRVRSDIVNYYKDIIFLASQELAGD
ncbi:MAG TPA: hypothetical protein VIH90_05690 [Candidatus Saccharimonadales bacterium]